MMRKVVPIAAILGVLASVLHADNEPVNPGALEVTLQNMVELIDADFKSVLCPSGFSEEDTQTGILAMKNCRSAGGGQSLQLSEVSTGKVVVERLAFPSDQTCSAEALKGIFLMLNKGTPQDNTSDLDYLMKGSDLVPGIPGDISVIIGCTLNTQNYHALITDKSEISF